MTNKISNYTFYVDATSNVIKSVLEDKPLQKFSPDYDFAPENAVLYGKNTCIVNLPLSAGEVLQKEIKLNFIPLGLFSGKINENYKNDLVSKLKQHGLSVGYVKREIK